MFNTDKCKGMEIAEQKREHDLDKVGIQESFQKKTAKIGCKVGEYAWIGESRKGDKTL